MRHKWFGVRSHNAIAGKLKSADLPPQSRAACTIVGQGASGAVMIETIAMSFGGLQLQILGVCPFVPA